MILRMAIGALIGASLGLGWYKLVGCSTGTCPLTRHPLIITLYGMILGMLMAGSFH